MKPTIVLLFLCFTLGYSSDIKCYDCEPSSVGRCATPDKDNIQAKPCSESSRNGNAVKKQISDIEGLLIEPRLDQGEEIEYECFSMYYVTGSEDSTGVYRDCVEKPKTILSSCEYLKETLGGGNVTLCQTCSENFCNTHDVGGVASFTASLAIVTVNLVLCLYVFNL